MKSIKILGLAMLAALALSAFSGVASASGPGYFQSYNLPTAMKGTATGTRGVLTIYSSSKCTSPEITGTLSNPTSSLSTSVKYSSGECSIQNMNGCKYIFHPPAEGINGTFDIGGAECKGITGANVVSYKIPAQNGLAATFENVGSGATASVLIHAHATGIKYEVTSEGGKGSYSDGTYETNWSMTGEYGGSPTWIGVEPHPGFSVNEGAGGFKFHSALFGLGIPMNVTAEQISTTIGGNVYNKATLETAAGALKCGSTGSALFVGPQSSDTTELNLLPYFSGCLFGGLPATATTSVSGCTDKFSLVNAGPPFLGSLTLCEMKIAVTGSKCTVTVSGQTRTGMEYLNAGSGANATVTAKANLSGLTYQVANGKECTGAPADGSYSNGKYIGGTSMSITNIGE